ncbi:Receptor protein kinase [Spatholobus suberectus]|nr:Receptor protein kinase [Spatholobus suberectus]
MISDARIHSSLDGNTGLCQTESCESNKKKSIVSLIASIAAAIVVLITMVVVMAIWRLKK